MRMDHEVQPFARDVLAEYAAIHGVRIVWGPRGFPFARQYVRSEQFERAWEKTDAKGNPIWNFHPGGAETPLAYSMQRKLVIWGPERVPGPTMGHSNYSDREASFVANLRALPHEVTHCVWPLEDQDQTPEGEWDSGMLLYELSWLDRLCAKRVEDADRALSLAHDAWEPVEVVEALRKAADLTRIGVRAAFKAWASYADEGGPAAISQGFNQNPGELVAVGQQIEEALRVVRELGLPNPWGP